MRNKFSRIERCIYGGTVSAQMTNCLHTGDLDQTSQCTLPLLEPCFSLWERGVMNTKE